MYQPYALFFIVCLLFSSIIFADDRHQFDVKELKESGKITSLEIILDKLSAHNINRLLEVELQKKNNQYIYEIEYLNDKGQVFEIEVDAVNAKVLKTEREY